MQDDQEQLTVSETVQAKHRRRGQEPASRQSERQQGKPGPSLPDVSRKLALLAQQLPLAYEPSDIKEALSGPDKDKWKAAVIDEIRSLRRNHT